MPLSTLLLIQALKLPKESPTPHAAVDFTFDSSIKNYRKSLQLRMPLSTLLLILASTGKNHHREEFKNLNTLILSEELGHTSMPRHPGHLNDSRCNSSSTEARVLVVNHLATARPLP
ncbi:hypothetical protein AVEN_178612-1 [Araneus ventricosus]|uniref:Uncharacterized protein n=1 Tax=Araneus ventricosus TaxID=182803 RepID=A0A4Y2V7C4_ARAVE|nr:hypothetical protein AVEN_125405-1 [Araneus ventricosus]GBO31019.1 hypothetical protein AVEN_178612-1 [Araneus ventricosus]